MIRTAAVDHVFPGAGSISGGDLNHAGIDMTNGAKDKGRKENGLVELTKKFIDQLKEAAD